MFCCSQVLPSVSFFMSRTHKFHISAYHFMSCIHHLLLQIVKIKMRGVGAGLIGIVFVPSFMKISQLFQKFKTLCVCARVRACVRETERERETIVVS
jgi:hypothetical protein